MHITVAFQQLFETAALIILQNVDKRLFSEHKLNHFLSLHPDMEKCINNLRRTVFHGGFSALKAIYKKHLLVCLFYTTFSAYTTHRLSKSNR